MADPNNHRLKIVGVDNYGNESRPDLLVCENVRNGHLGKMMVDALNAYSGEHGAHFFKLVEPDYKLWGGMAEFV
jgi:hypothetical protein